jgi:hypothetical protein
VIQTVKNSELKASVERIVRIHRRKVKMNQPKIWDERSGQFRFAIRGYLDGYVD